MEEKATYELFYRQPNRQRLINGAYANQGNIRGYCNCSGHRGYLTKALIKKHDCLKKQCFHFEKRNLSAWLKHSVENEKKKVDETFGKYLELLIRNTLSQNPHIYVTTVKRISSQQLQVSYIYDQKVDLSQVRKTLIKKCQQRINLKAVTTSKAVIAKLLTLPKELQTTDLLKAPKVGKATKKRLNDLGIFTLENLCNYDGELLYLFDCWLTKEKLNLRYQDAYCSAIAYAKKGNTIT